MDTTIQATRPPKIADPNDPHYKQVIRYISGGGKHCKSIDLMFSLIDGAMNPIEQPVAAADKAASTTGVVKSSGNEDRGDDAAVRRGNLMNQLVGLTDRIARAARSGEAVYTSRIVLDGCGKLIGGTPEVGAKSVADFSIRDLRALQDAGLVVFDENSGKVMLTENAVQGLINAVREIDDYFDNQGGEALGYHPPDQQVLEEKILDKKIPYIDPPPSIVRVWNK